MQVGGSQVNGNGPTTDLPGTAAVPTNTLEPVPTNTPIPTSTATVQPTPDLTSIGLPAELPANNAFDFVAAMCDAKWFTRAGVLPCPGTQSDPSAGYVLSLGGQAQGISPDLGVLLTYPAQDNYSTIFSEYPAFTVRKGDRFRAVLGCRAHTFCDVVFAFEYYTDQGKTGLMHWPYIFAETPLVIDYPLDSIAGKTVQFGLALTGTGNRLEATGVWIAPHIYRPAP